MNKFLRELKVDEIKWTFSNEADQEMKAALRFKTNEDTRGAPLDGRFFDMHTKYFVGNELVGAPKIYGLRINWI